MKRLLSLVLLAVVAVAAWSAERKLSLKGNIREIHVSAGVEVKYIPGSAYANVMVMGPQEKIGRVDVSLRDGVLGITVKSDEIGASNFFGLKSRNDVNGVKVTIYAPAVGTINVSSGADFEVETLLSVPGMSVRLKASSGSGIELKGLECASLDCVSLSGADIEIDSLTVSDVSFKSSSGSEIEAEHISADSLKAEASSGSKISLEGRAQRADLKVSSGAVVKASRLTSPDKNVKAVSGGSMR